jgi:two-component system, NarL family, nitrate/nitrite response regulator NarL
MRWTTVAGFDTSCKTAFSDFFLAFRQSKHMRTAKARGSMTHVYLYSDQPILAKGLEVVLATTGQFQLEGFFSGLALLLARLESEPPDILLVDLTPEVTFGVLSDFKRVVQESRVVLWVDAISTELAFQAIGLGVRGIRRKSLPAELQVKCLQKVYEGGLWFEKGLTDSFLTAKRVVLSRREGQLITLLSHGLKNKEIAFDLQISEGTVKVYLSRLYQKVGVSDRFELALWGLKNLTAGKAEKPLRFAGAPIPILQSLVMDRSAYQPAAPPPGR